MVQSSLKLNCCRSQRKRYQLKECHRHTTTKEHHIAERDGSHHVDFQATHVVAKLKQKGTKEMAFLMTQHEENRCIRHPLLALQANEIKFSKKWDGVTNFLRAPVS